jgi:hypothetical protein
MSRAGAAWFPAKRFRATNQYDTSVTQRPIAQHLSTNLKSKTIFSQH